MGPFLLLCCFFVFGVADLETTFSFTNIVGFVVRAGVFVYAAFLHRVRLRFVARAEDALELFACRDKGVASCLMKGSFKLVRDARYERYLGVRAEFHTVFRVIVIGRAMAVLISVAVVGFITMEGEDREKVSDGFWA